MCEESFLKLKKVLTEAPVLGFPDFKQSFILETDASLLGLGAVLSQQQEVGLVVLGYASRALRPSERNMNNYSSMKLELLALYWAIAQKYRDLLLGAEFTVFTDNNPLSYLQTTANSWAQLRRGGLLSLPNSTSTSNIVQDEATGMQMRSVEKCFMVKSCTVPLWKRLLANQP